VYNLLSKSDGLRGKENTFLLLYLGNNILEVREGQG
jgi:hypothetical protein